MTKPFINISAAIDGAPRIPDVELAARLGYRRPNHIRTMIVRHRAKLLPFGDLPSDQTAEGDTAPTKFWLNEKQAMWLTGVIQPKGLITLRRKLQAAFAAWNISDPAPEDDAEDPDKLDEPDQSDEPDEVTTSDLAIVDGVPRIHDLVLAKRLGLNPPREIRRLIERHRAELARESTLWEAPTKPEARGRPGKEFWLDRSQAIRVTMFSRTAAAETVRGQIIQVFMAWQDGAPAEPVEADRRVPATTVAEPPLDLPHGRSPELAATMFLDGWMRLDMVIPVSLGFEIIERYQTRLIAPPAGVHH